MTTISIAVSETLKEFIDAQVAEGNFGSPDEYIRQMLEQLQKDRAREKLEALLLEGLASPAREMTRQDWDGFRQRLDARLAEQES